MKAKIVMVENSNGTYTVEIQGNYSIVFGMLTETLVDVLRDGMKEEATPEQVADITRDFLLEKLKGSEQK